MTLTNEVYAHAGIDMDMTGGMPAIPANATSEGTVDISKLAPGTVVTIITKSMSKWVLTVQEDGKAMIQQYVWFIGAHYPAQKIFEEMYRLHKIIESVVMELETDLPMIKMGQVTVHIGDKSYDYHSRHEMPLYIIDGAKRLMPFSASEVLETERGHQLSGKILFWTIDE